MSRCEVFSLCGQFVAHLPVANWLRPACFFSMYSDICRDDDSVHGDCRKYLQPVQRHGTWLRTIGCSRFTKLITELCDVMRAV